jgi:hypothetical protein
VAERSRTTEAIRERDSSTHPIKVAENSLYRAPVRHVTNGLAKPRVNIGISDGQRRCMFHWSLMVGATLDQSKTPVSNNFCSAGRLSLLGKE